MANRLRKIRDDGTPYSRPHDVEILIDALQELPRDELIERCKILDSRDPSYVKSECILYFIRNTRFDNNDRSFEALFKILRLRVQRALPAIERQVSERGNALLQFSSIEIRDEVLDRFQELLCLDRTEYEARLDYFEIRFDGAISALRQSAKRKIWKGETRSQPLSNEDETSELSREVEDAIARLNPQSQEKFDDPVYRKRFASAIDSLPEDQMRVIVLLLKEIPIESNDPEAVTIVKVLACSEKTVRNRRDRAFKALRAALDEEIGG